MTPLPEENPHGGLQHDGPPHDEPVVDPTLIGPGYSDPGYSDPDDDLFDEAWQAPKRTNRLTVVLIVALLVVAGFAGGVLVQKHHDSGLVAAGAGTRRTPGTSGGAGGGFSGTGGGGRRQQGDQASTAPGADQGDGAPGGAGDTVAGPPVVVGTVRTVDTDAIEVTDTNGAIVRVFVPRTATVTTLGLGGLTFGTPVAVAGTKAVDGSVTATSVTVRPAGG